MMSPVSRRQEPAGPAADALVVRFGSLEKWKDKALKQAADSVEESGRPLLSVWVARSLPSEDEAETIRRVCDAAGLGYRYVRVAKVADLLTGGFQLVSDDPTADHEKAENLERSATCHYNVDIATVTDERVDEFLGRFGDPMPNPSRMASKRSKGATR